MYEIKDVISTLAVILGMVFGIVALFRNKKADDSGDGQKMGQIASDLGYVKANTDEIKAEQQRQRDANMAFSERLTKAEVRLEEHINASKPIRSRQAKDGG